MIKRDASTQRSQDVTIDGQALVQAEVHTEARHHSERGEAFIVRSGFVTSSATADVFVSLIFLKNDSTTKQLHIGYLRTCNEVAAKWKLIRNPTSISNPTAVIPLNMNFTSAKTFDGTAQSGSATSTTTGGTEMGTWIQGGPGHSDPDWSGSFILGPNDSIALEMAPFASVAGEICTTFEIWQTDIE